MNTTEINREYYNQLYKNKSTLLSIIHSFISFDQQSKSKNNFKIIKKYLGDRISKNLQVLDYGFGHGALLLKYKYNHILYGCDISEETVFNFKKVAKLLRKSVKTYTVNNFFEECKAIKFDVISLSHIIEHVSDDFDLVIQLSDKLSRDGVMLINVPINEVWKDPKHVREYNIKYLTSLLFKCKLKVVQIIEIDKLTSFFLIHEKIKNAGVFKLIIIRFFRMFFAVIPLNWVELIEKLFLKRHQYQQLIVLAIKE